MGQGPRLGLYWNRWQRLPLSRGHHDHGDGYMGLTEGEEVHTAVLCCCCPGGRRSAERRRHKPPQQPWARTMLWPSITAAWSRPRPPTCRWVLEGSPTNRSGRTTSSSSCPPPPHPLHPSRPVCSRGCCWLGGSWSADHCPVYRQPLPLLMTVHASAAAGEAQQQHDSQQHRRARGPQASAPARGAPVLLRAAAIQARHAASRARRAQDAKR